MAKFRKKPIVIEAEQYLHGRTVPLGVCMSDDLDDSREFFPHIHTLEGNLAVSKGDWIIKGIQGEFCPCKPDIFEATYEPVEAPMPLDAQTRVAELEALLAERFTVPCPTCHAPNYQGDSEDGWSSGCPDCGGSGVRHPLR